MSNLPKITKEEFLHCIYSGVKDAVWEVATNATHAPCADFYHSIRTGVADAVSGMEVNLDQSNRPV